MPKQSISSVIDEVDAQTPNPTRRAERVWAILREQHGSELDMWDLMCFAVGYLAAQHAAFPWVEEYVKPLNRLLHTAHYFKPQELGILPTSTQGGNNQSNSKT